MSRPLAKTINQYLKQRGSPMAGFGNAFVKAGTRHGVDPRLLVGIATIESGAGANMKLAYNPFNWGVHRGQTFGSWSEALNTVAKGLRKNYIAAGLTTPEQIVSKYAPASDNNDEGNWASVVSEVMSKLGSGGSAPITRAAPAQQQTVAPVGEMPQRTSAVPMFDPEAFKQSFQQRILSGEGLRGRELSDLITGSFRVPPPPPAAPGAPTPGAVPSEGLPLERQGEKMVLPTKWKSTHPTSGLSDQGFNHAIDIMGKPGTPVAAPVSGTIVRHGSAQGGSSIYFQGDDGRMYWIGHIESNVPVGTKVKRGQVIAQISADHAAPHVHLDYSTSYRG